jgi:hypothetical protein
MKYVSLTYLICFLSLLQEHRAPMNHLLGIPFWAKAPTSFQIFPTFPISSLILQLEKILKIL